MCMTGDLAEINKDFKTVRTNFNLFVREIITDEHLYNYAKNEEEDEYDMANNFMLYNLYLFKVAKEIRARHPRYGNKKFIATLADLSYGDIEGAKIYNLLERCNFERVRKLGMKMAELSLNHSIGDAETPTEFESGSDKRLVKTIGGLGKED